MYACMYDMYVRVCMCTHVYVCSLKFCWWMCNYVHVGVCMCMSMYVNVCVCVPKYMHTYVSACMDIWMYVCLQFPPGKPSF